VPGKAVETEKPMKGLRRGLVVACGLLLWCVLPAAAQSPKVLRIGFAAKDSSTTVKGSVIGRESIDYKLRAKASQVMSVTLQTSNGSNYFNVLPPGSADSAIFVGSSLGRFSGTLARDGDYTIRVYLMRSAARRNERANYTLTVGVGSGASAAPAESSSGDARVPGTPYHATGEIRCVMPGGGAPGFCPFGVVRQGYGTATVTVTKPDGRTRAIFFEKGKATGCDSGAADAGGFSATKRGDMHIVLIGEERYEIPDAVVFGG
jgi:hypothetical protein